jgi:flavin reductase (DIM6/NTAB) family NADH-FMN oxidoreductase RutF
MARVVNAREFKESLSKLATGVSIIATKSEDKFFGFTASSLASVSLEPPLISFCLNKNAASLSAFAKCDVFSVSILAENQEEISRHFASHLDDKFAGIKYHLGATYDCPLIEHAICWLECEKVQEFSTGDHIIFIGVVKTSKINNDLNPLVYYARNYRHLKL